MSENEIINYTDLIKSDYEYDDTMTYSHAKTRNF